MVEIDLHIAKEMEKLKVVTVLPVEHYHKNKMSLDTKRTEIRKLEDKIFQREEALRKSENMLAEDSIEFDTFLKNNDEKVQEALKRAEYQTKLKQDKVAEAARLQATTAHLKRDLSKYQDQLEDCKKYKDFLVGVTPKEWLIDIQDKPIAPSDTPEERMYFQRPGQLLEAFNNLEVKNLTLMQDCQDSEKALEDLRNKLRETRDANDSKITNLRTQLENLTASLKAEDELHAGLHDKIKVIMVDRKSEYTSEEIAEKSRLEENVLQLEGAPNDLIEQTEKVREKERRLHVRFARLEKARLEQERRALKSLERSQAPVHKRTGKPIMFRSVLVKNRKEKATASENDEENALEGFLERAY
ncbi:hypothetical protein SELMODRAFT_410288 [Selaginella moellendorffii]|uniref:DUF4200 domain-containing protein n=1 Tax=Selaginella moellendorffii TaxID=88036 RepID=D8REA0_SELML|nr:hypothetical protein SELMODRAFT_410288 [Selaginella moellendorffii]